MTNELTVRVADLKAALLSMRKAKKRITKKPFFTGNEYFSIPGISSQSFFAKNFAFFVRALWSIRLIPSRFPPCIWPFCTLHSAVRPPIMETLSPAHII